MEYYLLLKRLGFSENLEKVGYNWNNNSNALHVILDKYA